MQSTDDTRVLECTTTIIAAYVGNNTIQKENLSALIADTFATLTQAGRQEAPVEELIPAVPIKRSIQPDHIVCLEDGKKFKSLKRHLTSHYNMTPQEYRAKWGLPADYPMVAPNYALARSELAKQSGLGRRAILETAKPAKVARGAKGGTSQKAPAAKKGTAKKEAARTAA